MKKNRTNKKPIPFHLMSEESTIIANIHGQDEAATKKISLISILILCFAMFLMTGCANYGSARLDDTKEKPAEPIYIVTKSGNQCDVFNKEIADILTFAKKFNRSQYAQQYQAMSREKLFAIENRAKQTNCTFTSKPANTKLHHLSSL